MRVLQIKSKKFWSWVNSVKKHRDTYPPLIVNGNVISNDRDRANEFNKYFDSVFTKENVSNVSSLVNSKPPPINIDSIVFHPKAVFDELAKVDPGKCHPCL